MSLTEKLAKAAATNTVDKFIRKMVADSFGLWANITILKAEDFFLQFDVVLQRLPEASCRELLGIVLTQLTTDLIESKFATVPQKLVFLCVLSESILLHSSLTGRRLDDLVITVMKFDEEILPELCRIAVKLDKTVEALESVSWLVVAFWRLKLHLGLTCSTEDGGQTVHHSSFLIENYVNYSNSSVENAKDLLKQFRKATKACSNELCLAVLMSTYLSAVTSTVEQASQFVESFVKTLSHVDLSYFAENDIGWSYFVEKRWRTLLNSSLRLMESLGEQQRNELCLKLAQFVAAVTKFDPLPLKCCDRLLGVPSFLHYLLVSCFETVQLKVRLVDSSEEIFISPDRTSSCHKKAVVAQLITCFNETLVGNVDVVETSIKPIENLATIISIADWSLIEPVDRLLILVCMLCSSTGEWRPFEDDVFPTLYLSALVEFDSKANFQVNKNKLNATAERTFRQSHLALLQYVVHCSSSVTEANIDDWLKLFNTLLHKKRDNATDIPVADFVLRLLDSFTTKNCGSQSMLVARLLRTACRALSKRCSPSNCPTKHDLESRKKCLKQLTSTTLLNGELADFVRITIIDCCCVLLTCSDGEHDCSSEKLVGRLFDLSADVSVDSSEHVSVVANFFRVLIQRSLTTDTDQFKQALSNFATRFVQSVSTSSTDVQLSNDLKTVFRYLVDGNDRFVSTYSDNEPSDLIKTLIVCLVVFSDVATPADKETGSELSPQDLATNALRHCFENEKSIKVNASIKSLKQRCVVYSLLIQLLKLDSFVHHCHLVAVQFLHFLPLTAEETADNPMMERLIVLRIELLSALVAKIKALFSSGRHLLTVSVVGLIQLFWNYHSTQQKTAISEVNAAPIELICGLCARESNGQLARFFPVWISAYLRTYVSCSALLSDTWQLRNSFSNSVFALLPKCDRQALASMHSSLPDHLRPVWDQLYSEYKKYHKYTGLS